STGHEYARIEKGRFDVCHRLLYRCHEQFSDGLGIDFRVPDLRIEGAIECIRASGVTYDAILVDPWHQYDTSLRDLGAALSLLSDRGTIVVHDCLPPEGGDWIRPEFVPGHWCGVTFAAFVDFVHTVPGITHATI